MKKKLMTSAIAMAMLALTSGAEAGTSWGVTLIDFVGDGTGLALNVAGAPIVDGTAIVLIDTNGNGIGAAMADSWLWDPEDILLDTQAIGEKASYLPGEAALFSSTADKGWAQYPSNVQPTDDLYLVWFDKAFDAGATGPGHDVAFGVERFMGGVGTDPGDYSYFANGGVANFRTPAVPEPGTIALSLLGMGVLAMRRRRQA